MENMQIKWVKYEKHGENEGHLIKYKMVKYQVKEKAGKNEEEVDNEVVEEEEEEEEEVDQEADTVYEKGK